MSISAKDLRELLPQVEGQAQQAKDAYNQAQGALQLLRYLIEQAEQKEKQPETVVSE